MRPLSESTARIASNNFGRKYVALGRLLSQWDEVMGAEFSDKAQPLKLNYRKKKGEKKATARLDVATSAAYATVLSYQKDLILERINRIFGDRWITDLRFVISETGEAPLTKKKIKIPLTIDEKNYLSGVLDDLDDPEFKEKLEKLGKAILTENKT